MRAAHIKLASGPFLAALNLVRMRYGEQQGQVLVGLNAVFVCRTARPASDSRDFGLDPPGLCQPWSGASWHTNRRGRNRRHADGRGCHGTRATRTPCVARMASLAERLKTGGVGQKTVDGIVDVRKQE